RRRRGAPGADAQGVRRGAGRRRGAAGRRAGRAGRRRRRDRRQPRGGRGPDPRGHEDRPLAARAPHAAGRPDAPLHRARPRGAAGLPRHLGTEPLRAAPRRVPGRARVRLLLHVQPGRDPADHRLRGAVAGARRPDPGVSGGLRRGAMIIQGTTHRGDVQDRADVVVVGTGAGGGTLAAYLAERGWDVVMLEKGGFFRAEDFTQREEDAMAAFNGRRGLDASDDNSVFLTYAEAVGGCTVHYWGDSFRTPPDRLERWRSEHGLEWMTPAELDPHWEAIERELGIHICEEQLFNENNRLVRQGCEALGFEGGAVPTARVDCIGCGWTQFGCAYNRKSSQLITTIPRVSKSGGRVYSDARVERILIESGRAVGVEGSLIDREREGLRGRVGVGWEHVV